MPSDPNAKTRVRIAFLLLFVFIILFSVAAYLASDLGKLQDMIAARESRAALQGITRSAQIDEALVRHPQNKFLQLTAMATKAANETNAAVEKLSSEVEPAAISANSNLGAASRSELEALRRDLKTAEANAMTFMPRYIALLKTERDNVEKHALSLHVAKDAVREFLDHIDKRHAEVAAFTARMLSARADFFRAYANYVGILIAESDNYKVVNGQFLFPFQRTVDRYNAAAQAMTMASQRVAELEEERKGLLKSQQEGWVHFVSGS